MPFLVPLILKWLHWAEGGFGEQRYCAERPRGQSSTLTALPMPSLGLGSEGAGVAMNMERGQLGKWGQGQKGAVEKRLFWGGGKGG